MARFSPFKKATPWAAPKLAQATAQQGLLDNEAAARDNEIRAQNQQGLAKGYQHFTKDMETDPIADALRGGWDKVSGGGEAGVAGEFGETAGVTTGGTEVMAPVAGEMAAAEAGVMAPEALAAAEAAFGANAATAGGLATAAGTAAPVAAGVAPVAGAAAGTGVGIPLALALMAGSYLYGR